MPKIEKTFPNPYGGISEQSVELMLDQQCTDMVNCIPDVVLGTQRRNGTILNSTLPLGMGSTCFHFYDRGEGNERYFIHLSTLSTNPIRIFDITGVEKTVTYTDATNIYNYLGSSYINLKAITVQDRTFIINKTKVVTQNTVSTPYANYDKEAFYWLRRSSNDVNNKYNYAVYLNNVTYQYASNLSDAAAIGLRDLINASGLYTATSIGSVIKIVKNDGADFTFKAWDSWGSQASIGWKGTISKLSDLPASMPFDNVYVDITGDDANNFTDYFVHYSGGTWVETIDPKDTTRGSLNNMPIKIDRLSSGVFEVDFLDWELPHVGSVLTIPPPSFVNKTLNDIIFYKNRLGVASGANIILSETGGYYNFYSKTVLQVVDDDPIDIAIPSGDATNIYYAVAFQSGLFVFTKEAQYILKHADTLSPSTVSFDLISKEPIDIYVEPKNASNSLFFISTVGNNASQLREYKYSNNTLVADGIDLSVQTPHLLPTITKLVVEISLGYVFLFSNTTPTILYCYKYLQQGAERVQSAFFKFSFSFNILNLFINRARILLLKSGSTHDFSLGIDLLLNNNNKEDTIDDTLTKYQYISYFTIPRWNIKVMKLETPINTLVVKRLLFIGEGTYNVDIFRKDYNTTITRTFESNSTVNGSAAILGKNSNVVITLKSHDNKPFRLDSMILQGMYTQTNREVN